MEGWLRSWVSELRLTSRDLFQIHVPGSSQDKRLAWQDLTSHLIPTTSHIWLSQHVYYTLILLSSKIKGNARCLLLVTLWGVRCILEHAEAGAAWHVVCRWNRKKRCSGTNREVDHHWLLKMCAWQTLIDVAWVWCQFMKSNWSICLHVLGSSWWKSFRLHSTRQGLAFVKQMPTFCGLCEAPGTVAVYFAFDWSRAPLSSMSFPLIAGDWGDGSWREAPTFCFRQGAVCSEPASYEMFKQLRFAFQLLHCSDAAIFWDIAVFRASRLL